MTVFDRKTDIDAILFGGVLAFFAMAVQLRTSYVASIIGFFTLTYCLLR